MNYVIQFYNYSHFIKNLIKIRLLCSNFFFQLSKDEPRKFQVVNGKMNTIKILKHSIYTRINIIPMCSNFWNYFASNVISIKNTQNL